MQATVTIKSDHQTLRDLRRPEGVKRLNRDAYAVIPIILELVTGFNFERSSEVFLKLSPGCRDRSRVQQQSSGQRSRQGRRRQCNVFIKGNTRAKALQLTAYLCARQISHSVSSSGPRAHFSLVAPKNSMRVATRHTLDATTQLSSDRWSR